MQTEPIKAEAYQNLPDKFRRQHCKFEIGGMGRQETPVAQVAIPMVYDLLFEMGILDDWQRGAGVAFAAAQEAVMGIKRSIPRLGEGPSQIDTYYLIVRALPKERFRLLQTSCRPIAPQDNLKAMRHGLYVLAVDIQYAFDCLQKILDEHYACKRL